MVKLVGGWIDLNKKYGDMFKGDFNPNISNKNTLKVLSLTHHCPDCKAPPQKKCFLQLHFAYCDECGERFGVWARKGCARHPYSLGYNVIFKAVRDYWPDAAIEKLLAEGGSIPEDYTLGDDTDFVPPFMLESPAEENDRYGFLRCVSFTQAQLENKAAVPLLDYVHDIPAPRKANSIEEIISNAADITIYVNESPPKDDLLPTFEALSHTEFTPKTEAITDPNPVQGATTPKTVSKAQAQPSFATPRINRTGQPSKATEWLPTGMKKRDAKVLKQMRAVTGHVEKFAARTREQAEKDADKAVKEAQRAKKAVEKARREEEEAKKGKTRHKRK